MTTETIVAGLPKRSEVPAELTWDLTTIYPTDKQWESDFALVQNAIPRLQKFQNTLKDSGTVLLDTLKLRDEHALILGKLYCYANMRLHEDTANSVYQGLADRIGTLNNQFSEAAAFITPEILAIDPATLKSFIANTPGLTLYKFELEEIDRSRPHVRSAEVEALLAQAAEVTGAADKIYEQLTEADLKLPQIEDANGQLVQLTQGNYRARFLNSQDRGERKRAFQAMMGTYNNFRNALGALYAAQVKADIFSAKASNYNSSISAALDHINVPLSVYDTLLNTVHANIPTLNRYLELRKKLLKVDQLHMYDLYVPILGEVDYKISYEQAKEKVLEALKPLGKEYVESLRQGFQSRWVDVLENEGKRSGAYSWGAYGTQPFMLMNWQDGIDAMFTLAHEAGHSMHSFFTRKTQPFPYGDYTIFVAEVASICNEALLRHYLLETVTDKDIRLLIINDALEGFRTTLYRQALFAEFEKEAHAAAESGEPLTPDLICSLYKALVTKYYGAVCHIDDEIEMEWARIPHFYSPFYVYQYSTGISAATALAHQIISEGEPAVKRYLKFLSSGSSDYSINLLRAAGVDLSTSKPIQQALDTFSRYLDEFEKCLDK